MINLTLSVILQTSVLATGGQNYADAYHSTAETGRPLVVLVGAEWCPGCRQMKYTVIPQLEKQGSLQKVAFTCVNTDEQHELAGKLMRGGSIPQLIMFHKTDSGWTRQQLTGARSVSEIESFLKKGTEEPAPKLTSTQ